MAIFTSLAVAGFLAVEAGALTAGVAFVLNAAVGIVASLGLSYAAKALAGTPAASTSATSHFSTQGTLASGGDVARSFNLGYSMTAGSLVYANTSGGDTTTPNAYLHQVIAVSDMPGGTLQEVWINGALCTLDIPGVQDVGYPVNEYKKGGKEYLWIKYYDGTQTVADPFLVSTFGSDATRPYASTRVGKGIAYVICTSLVEDTLFTGFPTFKFALSGMPLYDPSKDSTNGGSGSHRYSDTTTWGGDGDNLPVVQAYNILRGIRYNGTWLYGLQTMTAARLPSVNWVAQIAKCRTTVTGESGTEPTYRSGGQIQVSGEIARAVETILTTCQGRMSEIGGFYKVHVGAPDSPTFSFTDDDLLSTEQQVFKPFFALANSVNGIQGTYPDPAQAWATATAAPYLRTDLEVLDGNRRLLANPSFDFVPYKAQVQRLQKSAVEEAQRARSHTVSFPPSFWAYLEPGEVGAWTSVRNGYSAKSFRVDGAVDKANLDVTASITEVDPADYSWTHATDFVPVTSGPTAFPRPAAQGVLDWAATPYTLLDTDGLGRRPAIRLTWDGTQPGVVGVQYEVRLAPDDSAVTKGRTDQLAAGAIIVSQSLIPNTAYEVRGQYLPSSPRDMLWSDWLSVTTPNVLTSLVEFDAGLHERVTVAFDQLYEVENRITQLIAATASIDISRNWLDKQSLRRELSSVSGTANARITEVFTVATSLTASLAQTELTVEANFGSLTASIHSENIARSDADSAITLRIDDFTAQTNSSFASVNQAIGANATSISALSFQQSSFSTTLNGHSATLSLLASSVNGNSVYLGLIGTIDGVTGGLILTGVGHNGTVSFNLLFRGDLIVDGTISAAKIAAGSITAIQLAASAITVDKIAAGAINTEKLAVNSVDILNIIAGAATKFDYVAWATQSIAVSGTFDVVSARAFQVRSSLAFVMVNVDINWPSGGTIQLIVDGSPVKGWQGGNYATTLCWMVPGLADGNHTFTVRFIVNGSPSGAGVWNTGQCYIQDLRR